MNRRWADSKMRKIDPRSQEGEGAEVANCCQDWMIIFFAVLSKWLIAGLSILTRQRWPCPIQSHVKLLGTSIIGGVVRRCFHSRMFCTILGLLKGLWENPMSAEPPDEMVWDGG